MPIYVPTAKIVDERVLSYFYQLMSTRAEEQGFSPDVFPVVGDLGLSDMMQMMRAGTDTGMRYYENAMAFANFAVTKEESYVDIRTVDSRVVDSYKSWLTDIATDRIMSRLHATVLEQVITDHPVEGVDWRRASDLTIRRESLGYVERDELRELEEKLGPMHYSACREVVKPRLIALELPRVEQRYVIPGTRHNFSDAFSLIESGSAEEMEIYGKLVELHAGFKFKKAA